MNLEELSSKIHKLKINHHLIVLDGPILGDQYCIKNTGRFWEVFYAERGEKLYLKTFDDESEACDYFYDWISKKMDYLLL